MASYYIATEKDLVNNSNSNSISSTSTVNSTTYYRCRSAADATSDFKVLGDFSEDDRLVRLEDCFHYQGAIGCTIGVRITERVVGSGYFRHITIRSTGSTLTASLSSSAVLGVSSKVIALFHASDLSEGMLAIEYDFTATAGSQTVTLVPTSYVAYLSTTSGYSYTESSSVSIVITTSVLSMAVFTPTVNFCDYYSLSSISVMDTVIQDYVTNEGVYDGDAFLCTVSSITVSTGSEITTSVGSIPVCAASYSSGEAAYINISPAWEYEGYESD